MNTDPEAFTETMQAAAVLGAALARFENALDWLREDSRQDMLRILGDAPADSTDGAP